MNAPVLAPSRRRPTPPGWRCVEESLIRDLPFRDFDQALGFVEQVAAAAEDHLRRPDMCIYAFNRVRLTIANPRHAGVTEAELRLLAKVDALIEARAR
jgi:4a-hydroxytetrahydrobiopterin dehydratase